MPGSDGYPTAEELTKVREWPWQEGFNPLMDFVESIWWAPDWGWHKKGGRYWVSTGGWSGNESIIRAMQENGLFWSSCWLSSRRGGHYRFDCPATPKGQG